MIKSTKITTLQICFATLILYLVLIQPNHPAAMTWGAFRLFPLELPAIALALIALGQTRSSRILRGLLVVGLTVIATLKVADFISFSALSRGFNPMVDMFLVDAFIRLLAGSIGAILTTLAVVSAVFAIATTAWLLWWATGRWASIRHSVNTARISGAAAVLASGVAIADVGRTMGFWALPVDPPGVAFTARLGVERAISVRTTLEELRSFRTIIDEDIFADDGTVLGAIDRDVIVIFVESYGRTSFDTPFYADVHRDTLAVYEKQLESLGLSMRSGFLTAPTQGGQSWLSHATFANGLWINNQTRYGAALTSGRETLFHHAAKAGFHTATVMPQITLDWPESDRMGFETVLAAADLGYQGLPFNWVTMPDQFTLAALDRLVRNGTDDRRAFVQVALASSHAPWVPIPDIIPWDMIGDGQVYNDIAVSGDPPDVVWRDHQRVREQYRKAIDYALRTVLEYAILHAENPPLMIVIGDHQAAEFVALDGRPDVPFHLIGPQHLVAPMAEAAPHVGLIPNEDTPIVAMDLMRNSLLDAYSVQTDAELGN
jgi:hypothetical protein